jgi:hypothetical protein
MEDTQSRTSLTPLLIASYETFGTFVRFDRMIWKVLQVAETTFRRLNASELLPAVYAGVKYVDGLKQIAVNHQEVAA